MKGVWFFGLIFMLVGGSASAQPVPGEELIRAMYDRYGEAWYDDLVFIQDIDYYDAEGQVDRSEVWYESMLLPARLRIDIAPVGTPTSRVNLFRSDTLFVLQGANILQTRPLVHGLLVLGFDVYKQAPDVTIQKLRSLGYDLSKLREDTWLGRRVYVVGADEGDETSRQFWIDQERLVFVRDLNGGNEVQFNNYEPIEGGWVAPEVLFFNQGNLSIVEEYREIRGNVGLEIDDFELGRVDPPTWVGGGS